MNRSNSNPARKYIADAVFYTAFPEYRNGAPEPSWWKPGDFRKVDFGALREALNPTPAEMSGFLLKEDRLRNYHHIYEMASEFGYDQFDINQGSYESLVNEIVFGSMGRHQFAPIMKSFAGHKLQHLNGEIEKVMPRRLLGLYTAELLEKAEM